MVQGIIKKSIIYLNRFTKIGYAGNNDPAFVFPSTYGQRKGKVSFSFHDK